MQISEWLHFLQDEPSYSLGLLILRRLLLTGEVEGVQLCPVVQRKGTEKA